MNLKYLMILLAFTSSAFASYDNLERQLVQKQTQEASAKEQFLRQTNFQEFNQKITGMVMEFGSRHGFASGAPQAVMNDLLPGRILSYEFATKDGFECKATPGDLSYLRRGRNPAILSCIQNGTLKHILVSR